MIRAEVVNLHLSNSARVRNIGRILHATPAGMRTLQSKGDALEGIDFMQHQPQDFMGLLGLK